jgi:formate hydrogenlyase transcriptional activator
MDFTFPRPKGPLPLVFADPNLEEESSASTESTDIQKIFRTLFDTAPAPILITNQQGRILAMNPETEKRFGYSREELIGADVEILIPERFRDIHRCHRKASEGEPFARVVDLGQETLMALRNGSELPVDVSVSCVRTHDGVLFYSIIRDISDRVAARQLAEHLIFEEALSGLSARFINLPSDAVDQEIITGLEIITIALGTDRATVAQVDSGTGDFIVTHAFVRPGIPYFPARVASEILPWLAKRVMNSEITKAEKPQDLPPEAFHERSYMESVGEKSTVIVPLRIGGQVIGGMSTDSFREHKHWEDRVVSRVQDAADIFANALSRKRTDDELHRAMTEIQELKDKLERENTCLREEVNLEHSHREVVGNSTAIRSVLKKAEQVACTDSAVLILGETGTGKELIARVIHEVSRRKDRPMVRVNCAALPATLIESELFGREKGAYTGALAREIGRFELADKSTIFLDEIGELPLELQSKMLRVLQEGEFERLGSPKTIRVDLRIIAATNRNLPALVKEGKFRQDLFYRLNVFPIMMPALRDRPEDIPALVWHILNDLGKRMGQRIEGVHPATMRKFQKYSWPGNVRELRNVIERNLILNAGPVFRAEPPDTEQDAGESLRRLDQVETEYFQNVLQTTHWRVRGPGGAADVIGLKPTTLEARLKKLGIRRSV